MFFLLYDCQSIFVHCTVGVCFVFCDLGSAMVNHYLCVLHSLLLLNFLGWFIKPPFIFDLFFFFPFFLSFSFLFSFWNLHMENIGSGWDLATHIWRLLFRCLFY